MTPQRNIRFTVMGEPATKSRPRFSTRGGKVRTYTPAPVKEAEAAVASAFLDAVGRLAPSARLTFGIEAAFHTGTGQHRDVDNMLKLVLDGLNKIAWADDRQVTEVIGRKLAAAGREDARTEVHIYVTGEMPNHKGVCKHCGQEFPRPPSHAGKVYCSQECRTAGVAARRKRKCGHCGGEFVRRGDNSEQKYCSTECRYAATHVESVCAACNTTFMRARSLCRSGNAYCSPECKATYWRDRRKSASKGTCDDCGGPTTKKQYKRCQDCHFAAGGRWADSDPADVTCAQCGRFATNGACAACTDPDT